MLGELLGMQIPYLGQPYLMLLLYGNQLSSRAIIGLLDLSSFSVGRRVGIGLCGGREGLGIVEVLFSPVISRLGCSLQKNGKQLLVAMAAW